MCAMNYCLTGSPIYFNCEIYPDVHHSFLKWLVTAPFRQTVKIYVSRNKRARSFLFHSLPVRYVYIIFEVSQLFATYMRAYIQRQGKASASALLCWKAPRRTTAPASRPAPFKPQTDDSSQSAKYGLGSCNGKSFGLFLSKTTAAKTGQRIRHFLNEPDSSKVNLLFNRNRKKKHQSGNIAKIANAVLHHILF